MERVRAYIGRHHVGIVAVLLFLFSGGAVYAAETVADDSVGSSQIIDRSIQRRDIAPGAVSRTIASFKAAPDQQLAYALSPVGFGDSSPGVRTFSTTANESVTSIVGRMAFNGRSCTANQGAHVVIGFTFAGEPRIDVSRFIPVDDSVHRYSFAVPIGAFRTGSVTSRTLEVRAGLDKPCSSGGPVRLNSLAFDVVGTA
jgi:hypothetical protein